MSNQQDKTLAFEAWMATGTVPFTAITQKASFDAGYAAGRDAERERVLAIVTEVGKMRARSKAVNTDWVAGVNAGTEQAALEITRRIKEQE